MLATLSLTLYPYNVGLTFIPHYIPTFYLALRRQTSRRQKTKLNICEIRPVSSRGDRGRAIFSHSSCFWPVRELSEKTIRRHPATLPHLRLQSNLRLLRNLRRLSSLSIVSFYRPFLSSIPIVSSLSLPQPIFEFFCFYLKRSNTEPA